MITKSEKDRLNYEILSIESLLSKVDNSTVMAFSMNKKLEGLRKELAERDTDEQEARAFLFFFGAPVKGSLGIESGFLSAALAPFQQMVTARTTLKWRGSVQKKGRMKDFKDSKLFLTALPRGSFGVELKKLTNVHVYHETHLADSLHEVVELINSVKNEEDFQEKMKSTAPRELSALKKFFKALDKNDAGVKLETGHLVSEFSQQEARDGLRRISEIQIDTEEVHVEGIFRGALLDTRTFDFQDVTETVIHGPIHEDIGEDEIAEFEEFVNLPCVVTMVKTITYQVDGGKKPTFKLIAIDPV